MDSQKQAIRQSIELIEELQHQLKNEEVRSSSLTEQANESLQLLKQTHHELAMIKLDRDILLEQLVLVLQLKEIPDQLCHQLYEDHFPTLRYRAKAGPSSETSNHAECIVRSLDLERKHAKTVFALKRTELELGEIQTQLSRRVADVRDLKSRLQDQSADFERQLHRERLDAARKARTVKPLPSNESGSMINEPAMQSTAEVNTCETGSS